MRRGLSYRWHPADAVQSTKTTVKGAEAWVYVSKSGTGCIAVIAYSGKRNNPDFHYTYRTQEMADKAISDWNSGLIETAKWKEDCKREDKERKEKFAKTVEVGDTFTTSWGYDQTNVDAYVVVERKGQFALIVQKCGLISNKDHKGPHDEVKPDPENKIGEPFKVMLNSRGFKADGHSASPSRGWQYQTGWGYGH